MKKDAKDKASIHAGAEISLRNLPSSLLGIQINFPAFLQTQIRVLTAVTLDPVANAEGIPPTFISYAHFLPNGILRETDAETELGTFGTALESLMYFFTPHEGASGLGVPPSAVRSLGNSPLTASSRQHCSVCSARERERWICTRANSGISPQT